MTVEQIVILFKDIAERHKQINGFKPSEDSSFGMIDDREFPLLTITPTDMNLPINENGFSEFVSSFDIKVLDLVNDNEDNKLHVYSDAIEILKDVVSEFSTHPYYIDLGLVISSDANMNKIEGLTDSDLFGYGTSLDITTPNKISFCGSPIDNLSGFDFSAPMAKVIDGANTYDVAQGSTYTCSAPVPSGIQYRRPLDTLVNVSHLLYDDGWQRANNKYNYPVNNLPEYTQDLDIATDPTGNTLLHNNAFGNKTRFTDINGVASLDISDIYTIDNLSGLGYYMTSSLSNKGNWAATFGAGGVLEQRNNDNLAGYNDYFAANIHMLDSVTNYNRIDIQNPCILPFRRVTKDHISSSNVRVSPLGAVLSRYYLNMQVGIWYADNLNTSRHMQMTRIHF
jgi:hypothetical protein